MYKRGTIYRLCWRHTIDRSCNCEILTYYCQCIQINKT
nr:MAG TPA_asm: hypothetical protein [Caudoviricetes sp.]